jgi:hypothetical protein
MPGGNVPGLPQQYFHANPRMPAPAGYVPPPRAVRWQENPIPTCDDIDIQEDLLVVEDPNAPVARFIIWMNDRRIFRSTWTAYRFPYLHFTGWWNGCTHGTAGDGTYVGHLGWHWKIENEMITVILPSTLVPELASFWAHLPRDPSLGNWNTSVIKCKALVAQMNIGAHQAAVANHYAPVIAYRLYWDNQQNISRVRDRAYVRSDFSVSVRKTYHAMVAKPSLTIAFILFLFLFIYTIVCFSLDWDGSWSWVSERLADTVALTLHYLALFLRSMWRTLVTCFRSFFEELRQDV